MMMAPLWRQAFDLVERPLASAAESWVQSDAFMDFTAMAFKVQRRLAGDVQRAAEQWLALWGLPSRADAVKLMNQVGSLERELRDLQRRLERREADPRQLGPDRQQKAA
jgi:hypothetical protein